MTTYYDAAKPHHTSAGFRNTYPHRPPGGYWKWQFGRWVDRLPKPPANNYAFPVAAAETEFLRANKNEPTLTWIGHATVLLQIAGVNILTDAHFGTRASPVSFAGPRRRVPLSLRLADLPHIHIVLISHNHYDHLDAGTVTSLAAQPGGSPRFFVPLGVARWMARRGITAVDEMDWWEQRDYMGLEVHFLPAQHWSARTLWDRNKTLWGGFAVLHPTLRFYYSGDTGYSLDFADIRRRFGGFDLAAIPIGCYAPRWFMRYQHVDPEEAVRIHLDVKAAYSVGVHWGSFELTDEPLDDPPMQLAAARTQQGVPAERFFVLNHGETRRLAPMLGA